MMHIIMVLDKEGWLDYNAIREQAKKLKPK